MAPLLFAAALVLSPAAAQPGPPFGLRFNFAQPPSAKEACAKLAERTVAPDGTPLLRKLGDLPPGLVEHAVMRTVNGCPVREILFAGQTYYLDAPTGGLERIDPVARITKQR